MEKSDVERAKDTVKKLTKPLAKPSRNRIGLPRGAVERRPYPGLNAELSDRMRGVLADQFAGFTLSEACEKNGCTANAFGNLTSRHPEAWSQCQQDMQESVLTNIGLNVWICRSLVSDAGPHAIRTLYELMTSRETSDAVRERAASDILKLLDVNGSAYVGARLEEAANRFADIAEAINGSTVGDTARSAGE